MQLRRHGTITVTEDVESDSEDSVPPEGSTPVYWPRETHPPRVGSLYDAPPWNRVPYLTHGYRLYHHAIDCVKSLFYAHNELANIWTHFIPSMYFIYLAYSLATEVYARFDDAVAAVWVCFYCLCAAATMLCSSIFHTFNCISHHHHFCLRLVDFSGISALIMGSSWPVVYYAFLCEPFWQRFYGIILTPLCAIALCLPFMTFFHVWRKARVTLYILLALGPLVMGAHSAYLFGVHSATVTQLFAHIFLSYATYAIGVAIYASRFPEALYPGSFNIWGHSHQIWHCFVASAAYLYLLGLREFVPWRLENSCEVALG